MQDKFLKEEKRIEEKSKEEINKLLIRSIINTTNNINVAQNNYEFAEGELIDYYLYEIKANQSKLNYLIKKSKKYGIELDRIGKLEILNSIENKIEEQSNVAEFVSHEFEFANEAKRLRR